VTALLLGPVLRRVAGDQATIWVETTRPGTVEVTAGPAGGKARTFHVYGHHYALVVVSGLPAESVTPYQVAIDGETVWPAGDLPPSVIGTRQPAGSQRIVFGSCREATSKTTAKRLPPDALDAYARRLAAARAREPEAAVPDVLALLGDQIYADELSPEVRRWLAGRERPDGAPPDQVVTFAEYARLYLESWSDPEIRWLLSTVPTVMVFDDHEIIDDWNSSLAWCQEMRRHPWWDERIAAGLSSYWVYQHLGNLAPEELAADTVYQAVLQSGEDASGILRDFGARAADGSAYRWSYRLDLGATRLVVLDNRGARVLTPGQRAMHTTDQWEWIVAQTRGEYRHLVLGCSLPWLLAPALHYVEAVMERLSDPRRGRVSVLIEQLRRRFDLEHWPAVGRSFAALTALLTDLGTGDRAPVTITVLGGDVHHSYVAPARLGPAVSSAVHQVVCSPMHNAVPPPLQLPLRAGWSRALGMIARAVARLVGVRRPPVRWRSLARPYFGNAIGTLVYSGQSARVTLEGTDSSGQLRPIVETPLS
jgi:hypothetical protein